MTNQRLLSLLITIALVLIPVSTLAQSELTVTVVTSVACDEATFLTTVEDSTGTYTLSWDFGDGETPEVSGIGASSTETHTYPGFKAKPFFEIWIFG